VLRAKEEEGMEPICDADEVRDCVPDYVDDCGDDKLAARAFHKLSPDEQDALLRKAFPLNRYGW